MQNLTELVHRLRRECPWDAAQTPLSLTRYAIEEAYEVEAAVQAGDITDIKQELGDLLLQVVFQCEMYQEQAAFDLNDVEAAICEKLIRRHPYVFAVSDANLSAEQVHQQWQVIKQQEQQQKKQQKLATQQQGITQRTAQTNVQDGLLSTIKPGPALLQAQYLQAQAATVGFDFASTEAAQQKLQEELAELEEAVLQQNVANIHAEFGDCLFALINVGRKLGVNTEAALLSTIHKFRSRFAVIEQHATAQNLSLDAMTLEQMESVWQQAKQFEKPK